MSEEIIPIERSATSENKHTFWCDYNSQRRHYYACLWLCDAYDAGRIVAEDVHGDCASAMQKGACNAYRMRQEERKENKAIYYAPSSKSSIESVSVTNTDSYKRGWEQVGAALGKKSEIPSRPNIAPLPKVTLRPVEPKREKDKPATPVAFNLASAITEAVKGHHDKKQQLEAIRRKVAELFKTDKEAAKKMLAVARKLEEKIGETA